MEKTVNLLYLLSFSEIFFSFLFWHALCKFKGNSSSLLSFSGLITPWSSRFSFFVIPAPAPECPGCRIACPNRHAA